MWPVTVDVAVLYFLIANGVLPAWLTWFTVLSSTAGFQVSPSHTLSGPRSPQVWDDISHHRAVWENRDAASVSKDSFPAEQNGAQPQSKGGAGGCCPTLPMMLLEHECAFALAGVAFSEGSGSALAVAGGGHLL